MKLSKKILSTTLSVLLFSAPIVRMSASAESMLYNPTNVASYVTVDWSTQYNSINELKNDADIFITGTVINQTIEQRYNLYFTHSYVQSPEGKIYDVLQTGAYINGTPYNIPIEAPLMTQCVNNDRRWSICILRST